MYQDKTLVFGKMNNHKTKGKLMKLINWEENIYIFLKNIQRQIIMTLFMERVKIFVVI